MCHRSLLYAMTHVRVIIIVICMGIWTSSANQIVWRNDCIDQTDGFHCYFNETRSIHCIDQRPSHSGLSYNYDSNPTRCDIGCDLSDGRCFHSMWENIIVYGIIGGSVLGLLIIFGLCLTANCKPGVRRDVPLLELKQSVDATEAR